MLEMSSIFDRNRQIQFFGSREHLSHVFAIRQKYNFTMFILKYGILTSTMTVFATTLVYSMQSRHEIYRTKFHINLKLYH